MAHIEEYLGDGVYCAFDGFQFLLRADHDGQEHTIVLEPETLAVLAAFVRRVMVMNAKDDQP